MAISNIPHLVSVTRAFNILKIRTLSLVTIERWNEQANHEAEESRPSSTQGRGEASSRVLANATGCHSITMPCNKWLRPGNAGFRTWQY